MVTFVQQKSKKEIERRRGGPGTAQEEAGVAKGAGVPARAGEAELTVELSQDRAALLARSSTAEQVAQTLRARIMAGFFPPGTHLSEEALAAGLAVSRNTVREAFRLLCHEWLAVHELNRGVFVAVPSTDDLADLYRIRRIVETAAATMADRAPHPALQAVRDAVDEGLRAAAVGRWADVGTADMAFHQAVTGLAASPRLDEMMRRVLAELRLAFHVMADPEQFHAPYLEHNAKIATLLERGEGAAAARELDAYLAAAEEQILEAYRVAREGSAGPSARVHTALRSAQP
jgi:DNA-binding GntR family transcriptional regulator